MKKLLKLGLFVLLAITLSGITFGLLTMKTVDFRFANDGHIICADHKDWGVMGGGTMNCYGIVPIVREPTPTPTPEVSPTGEVILKK